MLPATLNRLVCLGTITGLVAYLCLGFLTVRPNRLASGISFRFWEIASGWEAAVVIFLWVSLLSLGIWYAWSPRANLAMMLIANLLLASIMWAAGHSAARMLAQESPLTRVSLGAGAWTMLLMVYLVMLGVGPRLKRSRVILSSLWLWLLLGLVMSGALDSLSLLQEWQDRKARFIMEMLQHLTLAGMAVGLGSLVGIPLGIALYRKPLARQLIFPLLNLIQTVPSLALFGLLIAPLAVLSGRFHLMKDLGLAGIGWTPALIALTLYSLLPITRNVHTSLLAIDPGVLEAGAGMGMSRGQLLHRVQLPLAAPLILNGIRIAAVQTIGNTALAALIGAGGLGTFIFQGIGQSAPDLILLGALPVILLAVTADGLMQQVINFASPRGLSYG